MEINLQNIGPLSLLANITGQTNADLNGMENPFYKVFNALGQANSIGKTIPGLTNAKDLFVLYENANMNPTGMENANDIINEFLSKYGTGTGKDTDNGTDDKVNINQEYTFSGFGKKEQSQTNSDADETDLSGLDRDSGRIKEQSTTETKTVTAIEKEESKLTSLQTTSEKEIEDGGALSELFAWYENLQQTKTNAISEDDIEKALEFFGRFFQYHDNSAEDDSKTSNPASLNHAPQTEMLDSELIQIIKDASENPYDGHKLDQIKAWLSENTDTDVKNYGQIVSALVKEAHSRLTHSAVVSSASEKNSQTAVDTKENPTVKTGSMPDAQNLSHIGNLQHNDDDLAELSDTRPDEPTSGGDTKKVGDQLSTNESARNTEARPGDFSEEASDGVKRTDEKINGAKETTKATEPDPANTNLKEGVLDGKDTRIKPAGNTAETRAFSDLAADKPYGEIPGGSRETEKVTNRDPAEAKLNAASLNNGENADALQISKSTEADSFSGLTDERQHSRTNEAAGNEDKTASENANSKEANVTKPSTVTSQPLETNQNHMASDQNGTQAIGTKETITQEQARIKENTLSGIETVSEKSQPTNSANSDDSLRAEANNDASQKLGDKASGLQNQEKEDQKGQLDAKFNAVHKPGENKAQQKDFSQETQGLSKEAGAGIDREKEIQELSPKKERFNEPNVSNKEEKANTQIQQNATERTNNTGNTNNTIKTETITEGGAQTDTGPHLSKAENTKQSMVQPSAQSEKGEPEKNVIDQLVNKAVLELGRNKSELKIDIKPEHLGSLKIKIISEQQHMTAKISAENVHVKEIIEHNLDQLKTDLNKGGITVDSVDVSVDQEENFDRSGSRENFSKQVRQFNQFKRGGMANSGTDNKSSMRNYHKKETAIDYYA